MLLTLEGGPYLTVAVVPISIEVSYIGYNSTKKVLLPTDLNPNPY